MGVMEEDGRVLGGVSLRAELDRSGTMTAARAVALVAQVAVDLDGLAADGGLRSDIVDPANILLALDGSVSLAGSTSAVESGVAYLAPERVARTAPVGSASDVYSLACVLYECLTGQPPQAETGAPVVVQNVGPLVSPGFNAVLARGLAARPGDRFPSAGAFAVAARKALRDGDAGSAAPTFGPPPAQQNFPSTPGLAPGAVPYPFTVPVAPGTPMPSQSSADYRRVTDPLPKGTRRQLWITASAIVIAIALVTALVGFMPWSRLGVSHDSTGPAGPDPVTELPFDHPYQPEGLAVDADGSVYVTGEVYVPGAVGKKPRVLRLSPGEQKPSVMPFDAGSIYGVAVDPRDGDVYVVADSAVWSVGRGFSSRVQLPFPTLNLPRALTVDGLGAVYVAESAGKRPTSTVWKLSKGADQPVPLPFPDVASPSSIAVDRTGNVYLAARVEGSEYQLFKLAPGAVEAVRVFPGLDAEVIAVDSAGNLFAGVRSYHAVYKVSSATGEKSKLADTVPFAYGLAVDAGDNLYVAGSDLGGLQGRVFRMTKP